MVDQTVEMMVVLQAGWMVAMIFVAAWIVRSTVAPMVVAVLVLMVVESVTTFRIDGCINGCSVGLVRAEN